MGSHPGAAQSLGGARVSWADTFAGNMGFIWGQYAISRHKMPLWINDGVSDEEEASAEGEGKGFSLPELPAFISRMAQRW